MTSDPGGPAVDTTAGAPGAPQATHGDPAPAPRRHGFLAAPACLVRSSWWPSPSSCCVALVASPSDSGPNASENAMGQTVRIMYVHVSVAVACYLAFLVTAIGSVGYLWRRSDGWDALAAASAEVGCVFTALTLATGSVWGGFAWGTWWEWDPRLTSTLLMLVVYVGYLALRGAIVDPVVRAKRCTRGPGRPGQLMPMVHFWVEVVARPAPAGHHQPLRPHHRRVEVVCPDVRHAGGRGRLRVAHGPPLPTPVRADPVGEAGSRRGAGRTPEGAEAVAAGHLAPKGM